MKRLIPALALLAACATTNPATPRPRQNAIDPTPAVSLLQASRFDEAEAKAREILGKEPANAQANAVAAIATYQRTMHQLVQDVVAIAMTAIQTHMVNQQYLKYAVGQADAGLGVVEKLLAAAGGDSNFALDLCLACWRIDWNHDGRINGRDEAFFQIEQDAEGHELPAKDPRRNPTFRFDVGDIHWARAMVMFQHAALNIVTAYDLSVLEKFLSLESQREWPEAFALRLSDRARIKRAKALILDGLAAAELSRQLCLAETDDVNEWVPNPRQKNHPLPLPVDDALYQTWGEILGDVVRLVQGQEGLNIAELAQLGDHHWKTPPRGFLDIGQLLDQPADIVIKTKTVEGLGNVRADDPAAIERLLVEIFGDKYRMSMKPSPLLGRLRRMKGEIERGHESLERKLRYLLWLN
jgi:hypothetical protein